MLLAHLYTKMQNAPSQESLTAPCLSVKPVTLKDVAERAKVSQSVVSTVLNERQNGIFVSDGTRQNVLAAAAHLGYIARHRALPPIRKPGFNAPS